MKQFYRLVVTNKYSNKEIMDIYFMDLKEAENKKVELEEKNKNGLNNYNFFIYACYFN